MEICLRADFGSQIRLVGLTLCQLVLAGSFITLYFIIYGCTAIKTHPCLVSLPLEDHLWLTLLIAPRGSAGDFLEMLKSTGFMCGFPCCILTSPWTDFSAALVKVAAIREETMAMCWAFSPFLSQRRRPFSSVDHASLRRPAEAAKGCVQSVFLTQIWDQQRDKPGCVRHTRQAQSINKHFS